MFIALNFPFSRKNAESGMSSSPSLNIFSFHYSSLWNRDLVQNTCRSALDIIQKCSTVSFPEKYFIKAILFIVIIKIVLKLFLVHLY